MADWRSKLGERIKEQKPVVEAVPKVRVPSAAEDTNIFQDISQGIMNIPSSGYRNFIDPLVQLASHPIQSAKGIGDLISGSAQMLDQRITGNQIPPELDRTAAPQALMENFQQFYGNENLGQNLVNDPMRPVADALMLAGGAQAGNKIVQGVSAAGTRAIGAVPVSKALYRHSLGRAKLIEENVMNRAVKLGLEENVPLNKKGRQITLQHKQEVGKDIENIIKAAAADGKTVDPLEVVKAIRAEGEKNFSPLSGGANSRDFYNTYADAVLDAFKSEHEQKGGIPNRVSVDKMFEYKKNAQKELRPIYDQLIRDANATLSKEARRTKTAAEATGRELVSEVGGDLAALNKRYNAWSVLDDMIKNLTMKRSRDQWIPSDVTLPLAVEMAAKGKPGVATAIGAGRRAMSLFEDKAARQLYNRATGRRIVEDDLLRKIMETGQQGTIRAAGLTERMEE